MSSALRVLVVDDEPMVRRMLAEVLGDAGIDVIGQAADGVEGVALARTSQPDAILLDIRIAQAGSTRDRCQHLSRQRLPARRDRGRAQRPRQRGPGVRSCLTLSPRQPRRIVAVAV